MNTFKSSKSNERNITNIIALLLFCILGSCGAYIGGKVSSGHNKPELSRQGPITYTGFSKHESTFLPESTQLIDVACTNCTAVIGFRQLCSSDSTVVAIKDGKQIPAEPGEGVTIADAAGKYAMTIIHGHGVNRTCMISEGLFTVIMQDGGTVNVLP